MLLVCSTSTDDKLELQWDSVLWSILLRQMTSWDCNGTQCYEAVYWEELFHLYRWGNFKQHIPLEFFTFINFTWCKLIICIYVCLHMCVCVIERERKMLQLCSKTVSCKDAELIRSCQYKSFIGIRWKQVLFRGDNVSASHCIAAVGMWAKVNVCFQWHCVPRCVAEHILQCSTICRN
jgi:hypothetical protein